MKSNLPPHKQALGKFGEDLAASYLRKKGFRILIRNFKARYGELDIVCTKDNTLVFVEVKTRIGRSYGLPEEAVTSGKLREVIKTAQFYTQTHPTLPQVQRVDVVAVEVDENGALTRLEHIPNVTG